MKHLTQRDLTSLEKIRTMERIQDAFDAKIFVKDILVKLIPILNKKIENNDFDIINRPTFLGMWRYRKGMQFYFDIPFDDAKKLNLLSDKSKSKILQKEMFDYKLICHFDIFLAQLSITLFPKI